MDIWDADKLGLFVAFVVPGFVSLKVYQVLEPTSQKDAKEQLIDAVAYSSINYALLLWPIWYAEWSTLKSSHPKLYVAFYVFVVLVAPIVWALIWRTVRTTRALQKVLPHPTERPWDYVFRQRKPYWIVVTFKDGKRVGGRYDTNSFASSSPSTEQLYLQEAWEINSDGGLERPHNATAGLMILGAEIATVEFFRMEQDDGDDFKDTDPSGPQEGVATPAPEALR